MAKRGPKFKHDSEKRKNITIRLHPTTLERLDDMVNVQNEIAETFGGAKQTRTSFIERAIWKQAAKTN